jgi:biopolymer transport protein ExbD
MRNKIAIAPFASLFLILATLVTALPPSKGFNLRVAKLVPCGMDDRRIIVIQTLADGRLRINAVEVSHAQLGASLEAIFRTRAERFVFVTAEPDVPFSRVAEVIDVASVYVNNIAFWPTDHGLFEPGTEMCPEIVLQKWQLEQFRGAKPGLPVLH